MPLHQHKPHDITGANRMAIPSNFWKRTQTILGLTSTKARNRKRRTRRSKLEVLQARKMLSADGMVSISPSAFSIQKEAIPDLIVGPLPAVSAPVATSFSTTVEAPAFTPKESNSGEEVLAVIEEFENENSSGWKNLSQQKPQRDSLRSSDSSGTFYSLEGEGYGGEPEIEVFSNAQGLGSALVDDYTAVPFGASILNQAITKTFRVENDGTSTLTLSNLTVPSGFSIASGFGSTAISPGGYTTFSVTLDATTTGIYSGEIVFRNNDSDEDAFEIPVSGRIYDGPEIDVFYVRSEGDAELTDGYSQVGVGVAQTGNPISKTFRIENNGGPTLSLGTISVPSGFSLASGPGVSSLGPGESTTFTITMNATSAGSPIGNVSIYSNDSDENPFDFSITGLVVDANDIAVYDGTAEAGTSLTSGSSTVTFDNTYLGDPKTKTITIKNEGGYILTLGTISVPSGFSIVTGLGNTALGPGDSTSFVLALDATAAGSHSGTVSISNNDYDEDPFTFEVSGTVYDGPEIEVSVDGAQVEDNNGEVDFGKTDVNEPVQKTVYIENTGNSTLVLSSPSLPAGFSIVTGLTSTNVSPGSSTSFVVQMDALAVGTYGGNISFANNDADENPFDIYVTGIVYDGAEIEVYVGDPPGSTIEDGVDDYSFGVTDVGKPVQQTFTVKNIGVDDLTLGSITLPTGFSVVESFQSTTLAPDESTTFTIQLDATSIGTFSGELSFGNSDSDENPYNFDISGVVDPYTATLEVYDDLSPLALSYLFNLDPDPCNCNKCGCSTGTDADPKFQFNQYADVVLVAMVKIDPDIVLNDSLVVSGTFGGNTLTPSSPIDLSSSRDTDEIPVVFTLSKDEFNGNFFALYSLQLSSSNEFLKDGPITESGDVVLGYDGLSTPGVVFAQIDSNRAVIDMGDGNKTIFDADGLGGFTTRPGDFSTFAQITGGYELVNQYGHRFLLDNNGFQTSRIQSNGRQTDYSYTTINGQKLLSSISGEEDTISYNYDTDALLTSVTNLKGWEVSFGYDSEDRLRTITRVDPDGTGPLSTPVTTLAYDSEARLSSITEPGGLATSFTYDSTSRLATRTEADGALTTFISAQQAVIDDDEFIASVTDNRGTTIRRELDKSERVIREIDGEGHETLYERNEQGLVFKMTLPDPDDTGELEAPVYEYTYDSRGNMLTETLPDDSQRTWVYHATWNKPIEYTDANGNVTLYTYDSTKKLLLSETIVIGEVDDYDNLESDDLTTTFTYTDAPVDTDDPLTSLLETVTAPDGVVTKFEYEGGDLVKTYYAFGTPEEVFTATTYNSAGKKLTQTDELGRTTTYTYDDLSRLLTTTSPDPDGDGPLSAIVVTYTYNDKQLIASESINDRTTSYTYDSQGRLEKVTEEDPDKTDAIDAPETTYTYTSYGHVLTVTDSLGNTTTYGYTDRLLTSIAEADPDGTGPLTSPVTYFTYDDNGKILTTTNPLAETTTYTYDDIGRLVETTLPDPDGATTTLTALSNTIVYDDLGRIASKINFEGIETSYTYDLEGNVLTETTSLGTTHYTYDDAYRLTKVETEDPDDTGDLNALVTSIVYTAASQVAAMTTPKGTTYYTYDRRRRLTTEVTPDPDGAGGVKALRTSYRYDDVGNLIGMYQTERSDIQNINPLDLNDDGFVDDGDLGVLIELFEYGSTNSPYSDITGEGSLTGLDYVLLLGAIRLGDPAFGYDPDYEVEYQYDAMNRLIKVTDADPDDWNGPLDAPVTTFTYDSYGQVATETDPNGGITSYTYDDLGQLVKTTYADPDGEGTKSSPEVVYGYDYSGQLTSVNDELGKTTVYEYDNLGRLTKTTLPDPDGTGTATSPVYQRSYDAKGQLKSEIDPLGRTTVYAYDDMGRLVSITEPDPDGIAPAGPLSSPVTYYTYNNNGQLASIIDAESQTTSYTYTSAGQLHTVTDPRGVTTYAYDALGRTTSITEPDPDGTGSLAAPVTSFTFDDEGDLVTVSTLDGETSYEYDDMGRVTKVTMPDPDGQFAELAAWTTYTYNHLGQLMAETNRLGNSTWYDYDMLGRLIKKADAEGGETDYTYDSNSNMLTLTDPVGNTTTWTYDALNRTLTNTNELAETRTYDYDAAGNLTKYTDRNGRVTEYEYDDLQRRTAEKWMDGTTVVRTLSYVYDAASQLTSASDPDATYTFAYDNLGRSTSTDYDLASLGFDVIVEEAYDALGRRTSLAAEIDGTDDLLNEYQYDYLNRMTQLTQAGQSGGNTVAEKRVDFAYDSEDKYQFASITRYADLAGTEVVVTSNFGYDFADRLTSLAHVDGGSSSLAGYTWNYDEGNRITHFDVTGYSAEDAFYSYDDTDQLTGANRSGTTSDESYTYDDNGNRINANGDSYTTGDNNQLQSDGTYNYTYDDEGNLTRKTNTTDNSYTVYEYDYRNRLVSVTDYDDLDVKLQKVEYAYDFNNLLIGRQLDSNGDGTFDESGTFIYDNGQIILVLDETGDVEHRMLWGPQVDQLLADENALGDVYWALTDQLNTVRDWAEYDDASDTTSVVNHIAYDAFGNVLSETNGSLDAANFGFTARYFDEATGLQYNTNRWYDVTTGRWISQDPIGFDAGDENLYRYVGNSSLDTIDPDGLMEFYPMGHHWIPWEVIKNNTKRFTSGGISVALAYTSGKLDHRHNFGEYGGVKHSDYNKFVQEEFDKFYKMKKKKCLSGDDIKEFGDLLKAGKGANGETHKKIKAFNDAITESRNNYLKGSSRRGFRTQQTTKNLQRQGHALKNNRRFRQWITSIGVIGVIGSQLNKISQANEVMEHPEFRKGIEALASGDLVGADRAFLGHNENGVGGVVAVISDEIGHVAALDFKEAYETTKSELWSQSQATERDIRGCEIGQ